MRTTRRELEMMQVMMQEIVEAGRMIVVTDGKYYVPSQRKYSKTAIKRKILVLRDQLLEMSKDIERI